MRVGQKEKEGDQSKGMRSIAPERPERPTTARSRLPATPLAVPNLNMSSVLLRGNRTAISSLNRAMSSATAPLLLTPSEIGKDRNPSRVFLDASWHMPGSPRNAREEFKQKRLPGARFLDLDEVASSHKLGLKHMMPSGSTFAQACGT